MPNYQSTHTGAEIDAAVTFGCAPDSTPVSGHTVGVTSGGVYDAVKGVKDDLDAAVAEIDPDTIARIDGYYEDMTVGQTEQVLSTQTHVDKVPYLFRPTAGRADVGSVIGGNRARESITGGTVAWNQLCQDGDFPSDTNWRFADVTHSVAGGVLTITLDTENTPPVVMHDGAAPVVSGRVYLAMFDAKGSGKLALSLDNGSYNTNRITPYAELTNSWQTVAGVATYTDAGNTPRIRISGASADWSVGTSADIRNVMVIDLTRMFGSDIAAQILALETGVAGAGVAWFRKLFPALYYAYNAGEMVSVSGLQSHDTVGFNQFDGEYEQGNIKADGTDGTSTDYNRSKYIPIVPGQSYYTLNTDNTKRFYWYDANKNFISYDSTHNPAQAPDNAHYLRTVWNKTYVPNPANTVCINLSWSAGSRNGEYEPYEKHTYQLDSALALRGIPKLDGNQSLYYDGDEYAPQGTVTRRYGVVDLGTLSWSYQNANGRWLTGGLTSLIKKSATFDTVIPARSDKYIPVVYRATIPEGTIAYYGTNANVFVNNGSSTVQPSGYLVYELATPTTESAEPYAAYQIVDDWGTEQYVATPQTGLPALPVGHVTEYQTINMRDKLQHLPFLSDSGDGNYTIQQTGSQMALVPNTAPGRLDTLEGKLPAPPSADGTYRLTVTVSGGAAVYSWEV